MIKKNESLSVLYDISVLGMGWFSETARTGIFRATENILSRVVCENPGYEISFVASRNNYYQCLEYLNSHRDIFKDVEMPFPKHQFYLDREADRTAAYRALRLFFRGCQYMCRLISDQFIKGISGGVDIFHSTYFPIPGMIRKNKNIIRFLTVYDMIPILYPQYFDLKKVQQIKRVLDSLSPSDFVICISQSTRNDFCNTVSFDPSHVFVIPLAAGESFRPCEDSAEIERVKKQYRIPSGGRYLLSVSTWEPRKNVSRLVEAFQKIIEQEKLKDIYLVLVGARRWFGGEVLGKMKLSAEIREKIILTGYIPEQDLPPLYSGASAFVYLSFYEGFGLPPLEAMQCGVPVITSNTSSFPEVVDGAGIMVSPNDTDSICRHIMNILKNSALRKELSENSLRQAQRFSWSKCFEQTIDAYKAAMNERCR